MCTPYSLEDGSHEKERCARVTKDLVSLGDPSGDQSPPIRPCCLVLKGEWRREYLNTGTTIRDSTLKTPMLASATCFSTMGCVW